MPKIFVHVPRGTFDAVRRQGIASELTNLAIECERLPPSPFIKSAVWIYFSQYDSDEVFMGERPATVTAMSVQFYAMRGGLSPDAKKRLIAGVTEILGRHALLQDRIPVFMVIHETAEEDWGIFGANGNLAALRASTPDAPAL